MAEGRFACAETLDARIMRHGVMGSLHEREAFQQLIQKARSLLNTKEYSNDRKPFQSLFKKIKGIPLVSLLKSIRPQENQGNFLSSSAPCSENQFF